MASKKYKECPKCGKQLESNSIHRWRHLESGAVDCNQPAIDKFERTAYMLLTAVDRINGADEEVAKLCFKGMCKIVYSLGFAPNSAVVEMAVEVALRKHPERPPFSFGSANNSPYWQWRADVCRDIMAELNWTS